MNSIHIALISAMPEEVGTTIEKLENLKVNKYGDLTIYSGSWKNKDKQLNINVSLAWSGWGKVSASRAVTRLISSAGEEFPIDLVIFTGVAGSASNDLKQWDIIVPNSVIQYDMDASPLFKKYYIPALNVDRMKPVSKWFDWVYKSLIKAKEKSSLDQFGEIKTGLIATGDTFISDRRVIERMAHEIPNLKAVEMEGAAVAQVSIQENIPWVIIRVISDDANSSAPDNFTKFIEKYKYYSLNLLESVFSDYENFPN